MPHFLKYHKFSILLVLTGIVFYGAFAYHLERSDFIKLIGLFTGLFLISFRLIQLEKNNFWFLVGFALLCRLIFLPAIPNLSQDFYRFIWDGKLILENINPYLSTPNEFSTAFELSKTGFRRVNQELVLGMGSLSAGNFTSYPPINQLLFAISAFLGGKNILGSVIMMRIFIILADFGILYFGKKLLKNLNLPTYQIFWFLLNPFVIIELTGNIHFEGLMLFFFVWALYLLQKKKWFWSAVLFGLSISIKLFPLIFLPLLLNFFRRNFNLKKLIIFYTITGVTFLLTFLPFLSSEVIQNFSASLSLWFQKFEFNASIYYIMRWIGFQIKGFNMIETIGKILPFLTFLIILALTFFRKNKSLKNLLETMLFGITTYFLLATTVHPWYIATPLLISVFTRFRYAILWSCMVMLSYSAYIFPEVKENLWLIAIEYFALSGYLLYEILQKKAFLSSRR